MPYTEITRDEVPANSFRYGQLASITGFHVPADAWAVCTDCTHFDKAEVMSKVLVAHFLFRNEVEARECASRLKKVGPVTLVSPTALS